jgi:tetratricopeptide (TPR) repeat protein
MIPTKLQKRQEFWRIIHSPVCSDFVSYCSVFKIFLARCHNDQGHLADAETMYKRALAGYEKALGPEHTSTLRTVNNLRNLYRDQGRLADAESMYNRALAGNEKALGAEHTSTLDTVHNLGVLYADRGHLADAETMYMRALAGYDKALGAEHTSTLRTVNNLGALYADQGRLADAETMYKRALAGKEDALGAEHMSTLSTVDNLGLLYAGQGRVGDAVTMYRCAIAGYEKALGAEHLHSVTNFTDHFKARLFEMATSDIDLSIRVTVIRVLSDIETHFPLEEEEKEKLCLVLFDEEPRARRAVSSFAKTVWDEEVEEKLNGLRKLSEKDAARIGTKVLGVLLVKWGKALDNISGDTAESEIGDEDTENSNGRRQSKRRKELITLVTAED